MLLVFFAPGVLLGCALATRTSHGVLGVVVELTLVVQCTVEVTFKKGGRSGWVSRIDLFRSLARPASVSS
jgi:hypothetical protein